MDAKRFLRENQGAIIRLVEGDGRNDVLDLELAVSTETMNIGKDRKYLLPMNSQVVMSFSATTLQRVHLSIVMPLHLLSTNIVAFLQL